jgi:biopolymer transport protein ExbD/biopolymer transport protein TolR
MNSTDNPKADHPVSMRGANREDAMIVAVQRNGDVWLGYEKVVNIDELTLRIRDRLRRGAERKVYINADRRAKYGQIRQVLRAISSAGIENVAFLVYQREPGKNHQ